VRRSSCALGVVLILTGHSSMAIFSGCGGTSSSPSITVSVSPASANVAVNSTQDFVATVQNDGSNGGINWSLTQGGAPCSPACGSVSPMSTASGSSITYTPPTGVPPNVAVTLRATSMADTTRSASAAITIAPPLPISVSVTPPTANVPGNTGISSTATVLYDAANAGVTWSLTQAGSACSPGCGSVSPTSTASGAPATYTAPATVPANPTVTLTATSITDASRSASAVLTITPPPISVTVSPTSVLLGATALQQFTATVLNDPANKGVSWALTQQDTPCAPACGVVAPMSTASGEAATYTAPSTVPVNSSVAIVATSVSDSGKARGAAITLTNGTVKLVPAKLAFDRVTINTVSSIQMTLTNTGTSTLTINNININGGAASVFSQTNTCGAAIAAGTSCSILVSFQPTSANLYAATLTITDSSVDSPQQVSLQGKGQKPPSAALRSALSASSTIATPAPTGSSSVGTRLIRLVDSSRRDPYAANSAARELLVRFWYPASVADGCKPAEYTSPRVWNYFSELIQVRLPVVTTNSCLDAPLAGGKHPILLFTHGYTGTFTDYTFLFEDLASRGYVVASVDHTYEATAVEFPDGRLVESIPGSHFGHSTGNDAGQLAFAVSVRLADLKFVINQLKFLNENAGSPLVGGLEISRIALGGHSLGAVTALLAVEADPRIKAGIMIDGVVPEAPAKPLPTPMMWVAAGQYNWSREDRQLWSDMRGSRFALNFRGAEHLTPTDLIWLAPGAIKTGQMGPERTIAAIRDYIAAFLDASLQEGPTNPLLTGPSDEYPDVEVTVPEQPFFDRQ